MKKQILLLAILMVTLIGSAKDMKTLRVTTEPQMSCANCENKIKKNIRFEKGVHEISTDLENQVVTVVYDADKTDENKIVKAFDKIKYKATVLPNGCNGDSSSACSKEKGDCCKGKDAKSSNSKEKCCGKSDSKCTKDEKDCCKKEVKK